MTSARDDILARVRAAVAGSSVPDVPRRYVRHRDDDVAAPPLVDLLEDRLLDYRATVHRTSHEEVGTTVRGVLAAVLPADAPVVVPAGLPAGWVEGGVPDDGTRSPTDLDGFAAVVTGCAGAAAETGTIVLDASPDQGRRAVSLVPDVHICVVRAEQVVRTVPELLARLDPRRPLTFVSGPSATSDIELSRVEGVHGPRHLHVVLAVTEAVS